MFSKGIFSTPASLVLSSALLLCPLAATAQRHGGGSSAGVPGGSGRPDGVDEKDSLQDFHHAMAVQATSAQVAEFQALVKSTDEAKSKIENSARPASQANPAPDAVLNATQLNELIDKVRDDSKKFVDGFSDKQKSGLKDPTRRLAKADSDVEAEEKKLDQTVHVQNSAGPEANSRVESLDKAFTDFSNQQLALGREMSIVLANGDDLIFRLALVKNTANIGTQPTVIPVSGQLLQISAEGGQRKFKLEMVGDLSDLQQNITQLLRPEIERGRGCGERLVLRQASIVPATPASTLVLQLHYERWRCMGSISSELAEGDGSVEMKLVPAVEKSNALALTAQFSRIDAAGMMGESLRSGDLGDDLRDRVSHAILPALLSSANLKTSLPPAVQTSAVVESVRFQDGSAGRLTIVFDGAMEVTNDQVNLMASQLNQNLAAQGTASR